MNVLICVDIHKQVGGYRDLMFCVVYEGVLGLRVVAEVQIQDEELYRLKSKVQYTMFPHCSLPAFYLVVLFVKVNNMLFLISKAGPWKNCFQLISCVIIIWV